MSSSEYADPVAVPVRRNWSIAPHRHDQCSSPAWSTRWSRCRRRGWHGAIPATVLRWLSRYRWWHRWKRHAMAAVTEGPFPAHTCQDCKLMWQSTLWGPYGYGDYGDK